MTAINPRKLQGPWKDGYALDVQTLSSDYMGDNQYGHPQFDTKRSEIGELLNRLKYKSDKSVLPEIIETAAAFLKSQGWQIEVLVPVPPSRRGRSFQPVVEMSKLLAASIGVEFCSDCVVKVKDTPELKKVYELSKRIELLENAHQVACEKLQSRNVLLLDDLYRSGATLSSVARTITDRCAPKAIYVLTLSTSRKLR